MTDHIRTIERGDLKAEVFGTRDAMGVAAARHVLGRLARLQTEKQGTRILVGSAPSQDEFFRSLVSFSDSYGIDWSRVTVFHMDEYLGLSASHSQSFRRYQYEHFVSKVKLREFIEIRGESADPTAECERLEALLRKGPLDIVCLGFGENGHLAFNDPHVAEFNDPNWAKIVELDDDCRRQQVNDGCFPNIESVPTHAITITLKVFGEAGMLSGVVPAKTKAKAVAAALDGAVGPHCPATLCRIHPNAKLFLDTESSALVK